MSTCRFPLSADDEPPDYWPLEEEGDVYCTADETDLERMHMALAEVGLEPTRGGGGWVGWDRELTDAEVALVIKAELVAQR